MYTISIFLICFSAAYLYTFFFKKLAFKFNVLDIPGGRKIHKEPTPLLGGLAVYTAVMLGFVLCFVQLKILLPIIISSTLIMIIGLIDDIKDVAAEIRLVIQFIATLILINAGIRISFLPDNLWGNIGEVVLTLVWVIGITNAVNYIDGLNGLASGSIALSAFFFTIVAYQTNQYAVGLISIFLMASCLGFLLHNFKKKSIFLGDAGSTFIGFTIASIALLGNWAEDNIIKVTIPILILGIPIFDMVFTTIMRIKENKIHNVIEWFEYAGRDHFHHRLIDLQFGHESVVLFIYFINISLGISAIMVGNETGINGLLSLLQGIIIFALIGVLTVISKRRKVRD